jgi:Protein of unknown function (DUF4231)
MSMHAPALVKRFPRLWWRAGEIQPIIKPEDRADYPNLAEDFSYLDGELMPAFLQLNNEARRYQNNYYLAQLVLILGSALATTLGAIQAGLGGGNFWLGLAETVVAAGIGANVLRVGARTAQQDWLTKRVKAERLRSEYFLFLGRLDPYSSDAERHPNLVQRVAEIRASGAGG